MDESREPENDWSSRIEERRRKRDLARKASQQVKKQIFNAESLTSAEATELAGRYVAYRLEGLLHSVDARRDEISSGQIKDPNMRLIGEQKIEDFTQQRLELEQIIIEAARGEFGRLKSYVMQQGRYHLYTGETIPERAIEGRKWMQLGDAIPIKGSPFRPPKPAWMDKSLRTEDERD